MKTRLLGKTGESLSVVGFGGIVVMDTQVDEASRYVSQAIDRGINYFDVAPSYGNSEERLGPALQLYRREVFLACKTLQRTAAEAEKELHQSLKLLRTDYFDLYQLHAVNSDEEVDQILAPDGALEVFWRAREQGLVRYIGFSAHSEQAAIRLLDAFAFDSMLLPVNWACWEKGQFGPKAIERAQSKGTAILALKALAHRPWRADEIKKWGKCWYKPFDTLPEARAALHFTLSKPVTAAVSPGHAELLWLACDAVESLEEGMIESFPLPDIKDTPIFSSVG